MGSRILAWTRSPTVSPPPLALTITPPPSSQVPNQRKPATNPLTNAASSPNYLAWGPSHLRPHRCLIISSNQPRSQGSSSASRWKIQQGRSRDFLPASSVVRKRTIRNRTTAIRLPLSPTRRLLVRRSLGVAKRMQRRHHVRRCEGSQPV